MNELEIVNIISMSELSKRINGREVTIFQS